MGALDSRVAIVTGSGRGIGRSVALLLAKQGASVVVNDLGAALDGSGTDTGPAEQVVEEITGAGGKAIANGADISDHAAAEDLVKSAISEFGRLDILVNVAGILRDRMIFNMTAEEWDAVIRVHLRGTFNTSKFAAAHWRGIRDEAANNRIINFTSVSGLHGAPGQPNYAAAKMGIVGLTYSLANSLGRYGATANAISPGAATRMTDSVPDERRRTPDQQRLRRALPRQRRPGGGLPGLRAVPVHHRAGHPLGRVRGLAVQQAHPADPPHRQRALGRGAARRPDRAQLPRRAQAGPLAAAHLASYLAVPTWLGTAPWPAPSHPTAGSGHARRRRSRQPRAPFTPGDPPPLAPGGPAALTSSTSSSSDTAPIPASPGSPNSGSTSTGSATAWPSRPAAAGSSAAMYLLPRDHEATAATRQQAMEKANAMCSPVWNGPEIRLGKKLRPVSARALAGGAGSAASTRPGARPGCSPGTWRTGW